MMTDCLFEDLPLVARAVASAGSYPFTAIALVVVDHYASLPNYKEFEPDDGARERQPLRHGAPSPPLLFRI